MNNKNINNNMKYVENDPKDVAELRIMTKYKLTNKSCHIKCKLVPISIYFMIVFL